MIKQPSSLLLFAFLLLLFTVCQARSSIIPPTKDPFPHLLKSFKIPSDQAAAAAGAGSCSFAVTIKTSCSSSSFTRDRISLAFGDAYGNEVYAPRLDDPSSRTFERCSTDTFKIRGPCTYDICYLYLLRVGSDGWKPESVKVYGASGRALTFNYNTFLPNGVWYGFNHCTVESSPVI